MATPAVVTRNGGTGASSTTHTISLGTPTEGNLLLIVFRRSGSETTGASISFPSDWIEIPNPARTFDSFAERGYGTTAFTEIGRAHV